MKQGNYRDSATHIFGTISQETGLITFLGFKCVSGKTVFVGFPEGEGFLYGSFGKKFHNLNNSLEDNIDINNSLNNKNIDTNYEENMENIIIFVAR